MIKGVSEGRVSLSSTHTEDLCSSGVNKSDEGTISGADREQPHAENERQVSHSSTGPLEISITGIPVSRKN